MHSSIFTLRLVSAYWRKKIANNRKSNPADTNTKNANEDDYLANYSTEQEMEELVLEIQEEELHSGFLSPYIPLIEKTALDSALDFS